MAEENKTTQPIPETPSPAPTPAPAPVEEVMQVPVSQMQKLLDGMDELKTRLDQKDKDIAILNDTVSQQRLSEAKANLDVDKRQRVHFKKIDGKVVIGWPESVGEDKMNEWIFSPSNPTSPIGEALKCRFYFLDGTKSEMLDQVRLTRSNEQVFARVVEDMGEFAMVKFEDESISKDPVKVHRKYFNA